MTRYLVPALFLAGPALAHDGLHLHPHGIDAAWLALGLALGAGAGVAALVRVRARGRGRR